MSLLDKISSPDDLRKLKLEELPELCKEIREYLVACCSVNPGHLGSSLGAVEIAVAVHYVFDTPADKLVWDVGHQAYAHKILTGRKDAFVNNRKSGGISGFPNRFESEYDAFGTGHSSTSISSALGLAVASSLQGLDRHCIAVIGDGALTGGLAFEGINNAGAMKTDLLVVLNDNQISIDKNIGALHNYLLRVVTSKTYNKLKKSVWDSIGATSLRRSVQRVVKNVKAAVIHTSSGSFFQSLGFRYFGPVDGNDVIQMVEILQRLKDMKGPRILHAVTKKGKGFPAAEVDQTTWHAPGVFDPVTGKRIVAASKKDRYQDVFGEVLLELARRDSRVVGITPAMASGCGMNLLMREMPERCFDVGIAEGHAVTFSAGLAAGGLLPVCNIYSSFSQRAYDNIVHDVLLQKLKVIFCFDRSGLVGEDGATHHGMLDIVSLRSLPNIIICSPMDEMELKNMMYSASDESWGATAIRYPRGYGKGVEWRSALPQLISPGKARMISDGSGVALLSLGPIGNVAADAASEVLNITGEPILHYDMRFAVPLDKDAVDHAVSAADIIFTLEDANVEGGLFGAVAEYVSSAHPEKKVKICPVGVKGQFVSQGSQNELYKRCGMDVASIAERIFLEKRAKKD